MKRATFVAVLGALCLGRSLAYATEPGCEALTPPSVWEAKSRRAITEQDLLALRDMGPVANSDARAGILSVSPDGRQIAFPLRQADVARNRYCQGIFVLRLDTNERPTQVSVGGDIIQKSPQIGGFAAFTPSGVPLVVTPQWSPDGRRLAYLKHDASGVQVWVARANGRGEERLTQLAYDVEQLTWLSDGTSIIYAGRPALHDAFAAVEKEGDQGFLFDDRYMPVVSNQPLIRGQIATAYSVIDLRSHETRESTPNEVERLNKSGRSSDPNVTLLATQKNGRQVSYRVSDAEHVRPHGGLDVSGGGETPASCHRSECDEVGSLWWTYDGTAVVFLRREGWAQSETVLYRWQPGQGAPKRLLETEGVLIGCVIAAPGLVCGHETATQPRRIVKIDTTTGILTPLYNPNPEFDALTLGSVQRLHWTNGAGLEVFGDLVLPPNHGPGEKHPLVIVQYRARGFLRGGTGDEFPIQIFAAHGLAVLSIDHPESIGIARGAGTWEAVNRLNQNEWAERRSVDSALTTGVDLAIRTGTIDPDHIGISGLSDGASTLQFALLNGRSYQAAAMGTCCDEPEVINVLDGPAVATWFHQRGYPKIGDEDAEFWAPMSMARNAARIGTPILMQLADREYLGSLDAVAALKSLNKPLEVYVFPGEYHVKWQPRHRLAIYTRNVDWFDYWLAGRVNGGEDKIEQYRRWDAMKTTTANHAGGSPGQ